MIDTSGLYFAIPVACVGVILIWVCVWLAEMRGRNR